MGNKWGKACCINKANMVGVGLQPFHGSRLLNTLCFHVAPGLTPGHIPRRGKLTCGNNRHSWGAIEPGRERGDFQPFISPRDIGDDNSDKSRGGHGAGSLPGSDAAEPGGAWGDPPPILGARPAWPHLDSSRGTLHRPDRGSSHGAASQPHPGLPEQRVTAALAAAVPTVGGRSFSSPRLPPAPVPPTGQWGFVCCPEGAHWWELSPTCDLPGSSLRDKPVHPHSAPAPRCSHPHVCPQHLLPSPVGSTCSCHLNCERVAALGTIPLSLCRPPGPAPTEGQGRCRERSRDGGISPGGSVSGPVSSLPGQLPQLSARCAWPGCWVLAGAVRRMFHPPGLVRQGQQLLGTGWHHPLTAQQMVPPEPHMPGMLSPSPSGCSSPTLKSC